MAKGITSIGLLVRSQPFQGRSSRDQLDIAIAAASLGFDLELFFLGGAVMQLLAIRDPGSSGLPGGLKGWKALPGMTSVNAWTTQDALAHYAAPGTDLLLDLQATGSRELSLRLRGCDRTLVI